MRNIDRLIREDDGKIGYIAEKIDEMIDDLRNLMTCGNSCPAHTECDRSTDGCVFVFPRWLMQEEE